MNNLEEKLPIHKIIGVARAQSLMEAQKQIYALQTAQINIIEIAFKDNFCTELFAWIRGQFPHICLGAASILHLEQAQRAERAGVDFLVSPIADTGLMRFALDKGLTFVPGACTPTEIAQIVKFKSDFPFLKLFPSGSLCNFQGVKKVFPDLQFLLSSFPIAEIADFISSGANYFAIGSFLTEDLSLTSQRAEFLKELVSVNQSLI